MKFVLLEIKEDIKEAIQKDIDFQLNLVYFKYV